jgi:hypothetical protein
MKASRDGFLDGQSYILTYSDIINSLDALLNEPATAAAECGCVPAQISPTCTKGHVKGAFVLKAKERPSFSVDLEDYQ